jgi:membrane protein DedA with SNARE-associated domain
MPAPGLIPAASQTVETILQDLGLLGLAVLMFVENVFPPIPSEVVLPLAGYLAAQGDLPVAGVLAAATLGSVIGSVVLYEIARHGGRPLLLRHGRLFRVGPAELDRAEAWFLRRGPVIVLVGRCIPGVRSLVSLPAGLLQMNRLEYLGFTLVGTLVWNVLLIGAGWLLGSQWEKVSDVIGAASTPILAAVVLGLVVAGALWWRRRAAHAEAS